MSFSIKELLGPLLEYIWRGISYWATYEAGTRAEASKERSAQDTVIKDALKSDAELAKASPEKLHSVQEELRKLFP